MGIKDKFMEEIVFKWGLKYRVVFRHLERWRGRRSWKIRYKKRDKKSGGKKRNFKEFNVVGTQGIYSIFISFSSYLRDWILETKKARSRYICSPPWIIQR